MASILALIITLMCYLVPTTSGLYKQSRNEIYPEGTNITLKCSIPEIDSNLTIWLDTEQNITIFIGKFKTTTNRKFSNFEVSNISGDHSLYILNANVSDEGNYTCKEEDKDGIFGVRVEAVPTLAMYVNDIPITDINKEGFPVTIADLITIKCEALGAKPSVGLELRIGKSKWMKPVKETYLQDGLYSNTEAIFSHNVTSHNDTEVLCRTSGQISIPPVIALVKLVKMYAPICTIQRIEDEVTCYCDANPPVYQYKIIVNEKLEATSQHLHIYPNASANFTCLASNNVGIGQSTLPYVLENEDVPYSQTKRLTVLTVIIVALPCTIGTFCWYLQHRKQTRRDLKKNTNHNNHQPLQQPSPTEEVELPMLPKSGDVSVEADAE